MTDAIKRLRELPKWDNWITICAQGMGTGNEAVHFAEIGIHKDLLRFDTQKSLNIEEVSKRSGLSLSNFIKTDNGYEIKSSSPIQMARIMDMIFRDYLGVRPYPDQGNDYAVGAEW